MNTENKGAEPTDQQARYLRTLRDRARRIGKKSSSDLFELGEVLEEAADLLRGRFGVWVEHECGIEPRTAHGYRRAHTRLGPHKDLLIEQRVLPTVIIRLAAAGEDVRTEAIRMIASGRRLRIKDVQFLIKDKSGAGPDHHRSREVQGAPANTLNHLIAKAVDAAEARIEAYVADLGQGDLKGPDRANVLKSEADALAGMLARMLELLPEKLGDDAGSWVIMKDALAGFSATSGSRKMRVAADSVLMAYRAARHPEAPATGSMSKAINGSVQPLLVSRSEEIRSAEHSLTALEVCAGAGGQALGIERAGFKHVALVEIDRHACETLRANFPGSNVIEQDLRTFDPTPYRGVDLFCAGVPCQPFSQAGKMKGSGDDRDLFMEAMRIVEQARPWAIMLENVTGLLQSKFDDDRLDILQHLKRLGYEAQWHTVNSADYGVPQRRVRSVLVGFRDNAMRRFAWPEPNPNYVAHPWTITAALIDMVASRDWKGAAKWVEMADALAPTIIGGSSRKRGLDLGQANTALNWRRLGFNPKKFAKHSPGPDDEDLFMTLPMLATLQSFPAGWKFRGPRRAIFKQIANAFPHVVALHLGCAIRSALTGTYVDPREEMRLYFRRSRLSPKPIQVRPAEKSGQVTPVALPAPVRNSARLNLSKLTQGDENGPDDPD